MSGLWEIHVQSTKEGLTQIQSALTCSLLWTHTHINSHTPLCVLIFTHDPKAGFPNIILCVQPIIGPKCINTILISLVNICTRHQNCTSAIICPSLINLSVASKGVNVFFVTHAKCVILACCLAPSC